MCGICGFVHTGSNPGEVRQIVESMADQLQHRGPDDEGYYQSGDVALGARRLAIIDLDTGHQPVSNENGTVWLVFNGEIYNFRQLRDTLKAKGHEFRSEGDTEVIVHAYEEYGDNFLAKLNGMFALALWDSEHKRLVLARDRIGIKPLFFSVTKQGLVFGSELKAIMAYPGLPLDLDLVSLDQFLALEYVPAPRTIFKDIHKLEPGHKLVHEAGRTHIESYWRLRPRELPGDDQELAEQLRDLIEDSVRLRLVSDVPLGAFLSGGIDSSTILAFMSRVSPEPVRAFSIGFSDASYDELPYARLVAKRFSADHIEEVIHPDMYTLSEDLIAQFDEPFADFSIFPTYLVSKLARNHVTVVLSGDGGDEIFGGYDTYVAQSLDRYYRLLPRSLRQKLLPTVMGRLSPRAEKKGFVNKAKRFVEGGALASGLQHSRWMMFMTPEHKQRLYTSDLNRHLSNGSVPDLVESWFEVVDQLPGLTQQQYVDIHTYLPDDILTKVDRMTMAVSLEARVPLLDHRLVEFAWNLPERLKMHRMRTKILLRKAMADLLPEEVLFKPKEGFSVPIKHWLRGPLRPVMEDLLSEGEIRSAGLFREGCVRGWVKEHLGGHANHSHRLWALMVFQMWRRQVKNKRSSRI